MRQTSRRTLSAPRKSLLISVMALSAALTAAGPCMAAPATGKARQAADRTPGAAAASAPRGEGLDSLDSGRVMAELADRGLDSLLDYYFQTHNIPEAQQKGIRTLKALRELND